MIHKFIKQENQKLQKVSLNILVVFLLDMYTKFDVEQLEQFLQIINDIVIGLIIRLI